jgi:hypothetical protein
LDDVRVALASFRDEVDSALVSVDMEMNRTLTWLQVDQLQFWNNQIRVWGEKLNEAKGDLHRKQITSFNREGHSFVEERLAIRKCKARIEEAEEKAKLCRKWARLVEEAITEYKAQSISLAAALDREIPDAMSLLQRMALSIEEYLRGEGSRG